MPQRIQQQVSGTGAEVSSARRAAVYVRVSTKGQEEDGTSLDTQEVACRRYAEEHGYEVGPEDVYRETFTGTELYDRPRLTALRREIEARTIAAVIVYSTDRLARNPIHTALVAERCERLGVALHFVSEPLDTSPEGALIRYVKGYAAQVEHEKIRERSIRGKRAYVERGQLLNAGGDLYGYRRNRETRTRAIYEPEAAIVRQIFAWVAVDHIPMRAIVRRLNDDEVPTPSAGKREYAEGRTVRWGRSTIYRMLQDEQYTGVTYAWRTKRSKTFRGLVRPKEEWIRLPDDVTPAIVSRETFDKAQAALKTRAALDTTRNEQHPYLLRGRIYCAVCGTRMLPDLENAKRRTYRCYSRDTANGPCGGARVNADAIEEWVWSKVDAILRNPELIAQEVARQADEGTHGLFVQDRDAARREIAKRAREQERLVRRLGQEEDDNVWPLIKKRLDALEAEKRQLQAASDDLDARIAAQREATARLASLTDYCATVAANLDSFDFDDKRLAVDALELRIDANGGGDTADWRISGSVPLVEGDGGTRITSKYYVHLPRQSPAPV